MGRIRNPSRLQRERADDFLESHLCSVAAAVVGSAAIGYAGSQQASSRAQASGEFGNMLALNESIVAAQNADKVKALLAPFVAAGQGAVQQQGNLIGANGNDAQQAAIDQLRGSPGFQSLLKQGENSILANGSATGGLRGGNTQAALAKFSPALLAQTINDRFAQYGSLASAGQNAAIGTGNVNASGANTQSAILAQLAGNNANMNNQITAANNQGYNSIASGLGAFAGLQGGSSSGGGITSAVPQTQTFGSGYVPNVFSGTNGGI